MDKKYDFISHEKKFYALWEERGYFTAQNHTKKPPFSIILPPPNANADLHLGHAMYVYEDIMTRYHKLKGFETLWLAGADHAGIETQFVYEKHLKKQGKSRFDFDRETLFSDIWKFVMDNRGIMENQLRKLGFALDWTKKKFTMDEDIVRRVYQTFVHLHKEGLVYRAHRLVNYCTSCGTSFSDLEVEDLEVTGKLYHITYKVKEGGSVTVATTRPETYFGDAAVMVHPKDKRYKDLIGKTAMLPLFDPSFGREIPIIADESVDMKFGTGAVKVTPLHDGTDFEVAKRHNISYPIPIIGFDGKLKDTLPRYDGLKVAEARKKLLTELEEKGFLEKTVPHKMVLKKCYRCKSTLEPLPKEQWFINVDSLKKEAIARVKKDEIKIYPKRFKKQLIQILENFIDWNISRQIVWGIRIPAYYCEKNKDWFVSVEKPKSCKICGSCEFVQDEDTFDTWFSSAQWPFATLQSQNESLFDTFYPTSVMETGYDILRAWVSRMIMIGVFETGNVPFKSVYLHGMVRDTKGQKMSKSKGNVINPLDMIDKYGADALRAALVFGTKSGGDVVLSEEKIVAMRNFCNKLWNIGRFIDGCSSRSTSLPPGEPTDASPVLKALLKEFASVEKSYHRYFERFEFSKAFDLLYDFVWHRYADYYIETLKEDMRGSTSQSFEKMKKVYESSLQMLHPFIPFVTEAVSMALKQDESSLLESRF